MHFRLHSKTGLLFALGICVVAALGCDQTPTSPPQDTGTQDSTPVILRNYDASRGGVQITEIAYDQAANAKVGVADEYIILKSDGTLSIHGWTLNAGDAGQDYPLPDTIFSTLYIYTHAAPHPASKTEFGLNLSSGKFIWNNSDADTASLYNAADSLIDRLTYKL